MDASSTAKGDNVGMSGDDDIEKLLREVDAMSAGGQAKTPATRPAGTDTATTRSGSPLRTGLVAGVVCGLGVGSATFFLQWLPLIDNPLSSAGGAFVGAFVTGTVVSWRRKK